MRRLLALMLLVPAISYGACLQDVKASFMRLSTNSIPLALHTNQQFEGNSYRRTLSTRFGLHTHFQGIVREQNGNRFIISGGDKYSQKGSLFIAAFASQSGKPFLQQNFKQFYVSSIPAGDRFQTRVDVSQGEFWHAGSLGMVENYLAVPIESKKSHSSKILFYDLDFNPPKKLTTEINHKGSLAGAILFFKLQQKYIASINSRGRLLFFESISNNLQDGFGKLSFELTTKINGEGNSVLTQCDGKVFVLDLQNTSKVSPVIAGKDVASLYLFDYASKTFSFVAQRVFDTGEFCNFDAGSSSYINIEGKLAIYSTYFYRVEDGKLFKLCQLQETPI